jgi:predicted MFS family arabinose efflux permease
VFATYRTALATPGAKQFTVAGLIGRLPMSTLGLGIVLLVVHETGSYSLGGAVSAASVLAEAVGAPILGRITDRIGQRRLLLVAVVGFASAVLALLVAVEERWSKPVLFTISAATGALYPPISACVRARWTYVLGSGPTLQTAFALESVNDEIVFIAGPVIVTVLATQVHQLAGLLTVLALTAIGIVWLASQRRTEPPRRTDSHQAADRMPKAWLASMVAVCVFLGSLFGATEVITVAFADEHGRPGVTGLLLAGWAFGSMLAGIIVGAVTWKASSARRFKFGTLALAVVMLPLPFIDNLAVLGIALFIAGFAISPTFVAAFSWIESTVPPARLTEGITWLTTGIALGIAPGAAISGRLIDDYGASQAFYMPVVAGIVAASIAWATGARDEPRVQVLEEA